MTEAQALKLLRQYNRWRRHGPDDPFSQPKKSNPKMPDPKQIGLAIEVACIALAERKAVYDALRKSAAGAWE